MIKRKQCNILFIFLREIIAVEEIVSILKWLSISSVHIFDEFSIQEKQMNWSNILNFGKLTS